MHTCTFLTLQGCTQTYCETILSVKFGYKLVIKVYQKKKKRTKYKKCMKKEKERQVLVHHWWSAYERWLYKLFSDLQEFSILLLCILLVKFFIKHTTNVNPHSSLLCSIIETFSCYIPYFWMVINFVNKQLHIYLISYILN